MQRSREEWRLAIVLSLLEFVNVPKCDKISIECSFLCWYGAHGASTHPCSNIIHVPKPSHHVANPYHGIFRPKPLINLKCNGVCAVCTVTTWHAHFIANTVPGKFVRTSNGSVLLWRVSNSAWWQVLLLMYPYLFTIVIWGRRRDEVSMKVPPKWLTDLEALERIMTVSLRQPITESKHLTHRSQVEIFLSFQV